MKQGIMRAALLGAIAMGIVVSGCAQLLGIEDTVVVDGDAGVGDGSTGIPADALGCTGPADCGADSPVCDTTRGICVECLESAQCADSVRGPVCNEASNTCGCDDHPQCDSEVCGDNGACVDQGEVIYVNNQRGTDDPGCGALDQPCLAIANGIERAAAERRIWVRVQGSQTIYSESLVFINRQVNLVGDSNTLISSRTQGNAVLTLSSEAEVGVHNISLQDATADGSGVGGHGVLCEGSQMRLRGVTIDGNAGIGINTAGCNLTVERSIIRLNDGGGVLLDGGSFTITNTVITDNGGQKSNVGGLLFSGSANGTVQFSTIVRNEMANIGRAPGVRCEQSGNVSASSNIVADNRPSTQNQVEGPNCSWSFSVIAQGALPPGGTNAALNCNLNAAQRLSPDSPCVDRADPDATITVDIDGDPRPAGSGFDIGADELSAIAQ